MDDAQVRRLRRYASPLATLDPDELDGSDLDAIAGLVGDARAVFLGESMHRVHEFLDVRHRITRFLVERLGFTAVVAESGFAEGRLVDDWIMGRSATPPRDVLQRGVTYHHGKSQEMLDQLAWMRRRNLRATRPVRFFGMDLPASAATARPAVVAALDALDRYDPEYAARVRAHLLPMFDHLPPDDGGLAWAAVAIASYLALEPDARHPLTAAIGELAERIAARRPAILDRAEADGDPDAFEVVDFAVQCAVVARHADAFLAAMVDAPGRRYPPANVRDLAMAESVRWVLGRHDRIVVLAANGHVQRSPFHAPPLVPEPQPTLGQHLARELRGRSVVIGTTYGGGATWLHRPRPDDAPGHSTPFVDDLPEPAPESLDAMLAEATRDPDECLLVDLRGVRGDPILAPRLAATSGTAHGPHLLTSDPASAFDAVVHVGRVSPWHTWIDERGLTP
ncbi:erythromycin esterase [Agromyces flavus]|uniref:Erythromycin esterase n=1 Tax=Agromyces flavus TaxID=589382 RepID=A0A1H1ZG05_9MICO|nr:erythromycin esterase family protein [Agromyces flavus]MCP2367075.1 erythromycin esterase [Agromyces flavus]GGI46450.1 erythromycin esterase [Agromyces flavus]SDT32583.1 erythromycin esterase [Agromyces flavus]